MAHGIYFTSIEPAGKTAIGISICKILQNKGKKIAYYVPIKMNGASGHPSNDDNLAADILDIECDLEKASTLTLSPMELWNRLTEENDSLIQSIKKNYSDIAMDRDFILVEGLSGFIEDATATLACYKISENLNLPVIVVLKYSPDISPAKLEKANKELGERFLGVILNYIPKKKDRFLIQKICDIFNSAGIPVLATIPEERFMLGLSLKDFVQLIDGEFIYNTGSDNIIENIMLGAMTPDSGKDYFNRLSNKAAIVNSTRADMQLAALETQTNCLVVTGESALLPQVLFNAETKKIPVVRSKFSSHEVIGIIENKFYSTTDIDKQKVLKFYNSIRSMDITRLLNTIGIKS